MCAAVVAAASADVTRAIPPSALLFAFEHTSATTGDVISIRMTTRGKDRVRALRRPIRLYLAPKSSAPSLRTRFDPRLHFVGAMVRGSGGKLRFRVPPLDTGDYVAAAWCPGCASLTGGRTFFAFTPGPSPSPRFRAFWLNVQLPSAAETCPVTGGGRYGNGLLATRLPADGTVRAQQRPEGLFQKLGWDALTTFADSLVVRGERLDGPGEMRFVRANRGGAVYAGLYGWMTPVYFSSEGCWRVTARVDDVALSYVAKVVAAR